MKKKKLIFPKTGQLVEVLRETFVDPASFFNIHRGSRETMFLEEQEAHLAGHLCLVVKDRMDLTKYILHNADGVPQYVVSPSSEILGPDGKIWNVDNRFLRVLPESKDDNP